MGIIALPNNTSDCVAEIRTLVKVSRSAFVLCDKTCFHSLALHLAAEKKSAHELI